MPATGVPELARRGLVGALHGVVDDELGNAFDSVSWQIDPQAAREALAIPPLTAEVLFYAAREAMRNAARYGRGRDAARPLHLRLELAWRDGLEITIEDDGVGLGVAEDSNAGSGQGLALHSTMMAVVGGTLAVESLPDAYTRVSLTLPQGTW
jgi:signal transduction histidine kinase